MKQNIVYIIEKKGTNGWYPISGGCHILEENGKRAAEQLNEFQPGHEYRSIPYSSDVNSEVKS